MDALRELTRKTDRGGDRALLDEVFDRCLVGTLSTVLDDEPWAIPILVVRDGDRLLLHGTTGAGALRHAAAGAKVAVSAYLLDALVIAEAQIDHSANYRSAVVCGICEVIDGDERATVLDLFTGTLIPGRDLECPPHTARDIAQTLVLALPITVGRWISKARRGPAAPSETAWTGTIPVRRNYGAPQSDSSYPVPLSVERLVADQ
jgi:nitroimidazol reductase NimA-like FMN-containing flavoprotein (pyridoxamine 5'-phosphate oxidase superfamily)